MAVLVLAGCSSQAPQPLKKGKKAIDAASVVRQKMPASVKTAMHAKISPPPFESQGLAPTLETFYSGVGGGAAGVNYKGRSGRSGLSRKSWQEDPAVVLNDAHSCFTGSYRAKNQIAKRQKL
ncbi:hypothetical protein ACLK1T_05330 [Escherichia coli]